MWRFSMVFCSRPHGEYIEQMAAEKIAQRVVLKFDVDVATTPL
jgi:hypothetical protein